MTAASSAFPTLWRSPSTWPPKPGSATGGSRASPRVSMNSTTSSAACRPRISSSSPVGPAWARPPSPPISASISPKPTVRGAARRHPCDDERRHRRLLLARNVGRAIGDPYHRRTGGRALAQDPPRRHFRGRISPRRAGRARHADRALLHRPDRRHFHRPAHGPRASAEAPARPRSAHRRLSCSCCRPRRRAATTACRN